MDVDIGAVHMLLAIFILKLYRCFSVTDDLAALTYIKVFLLVVILLLPPRPPKFSLFVYVSTFQGT